MKIKKPEGLFSRTITIRTKLYRRLVNVNRNIRIPERKKIFICSRNRRGRDGEGESPKGLVKANLPMREVVHSDYGLQSVIAIHKLILRTLP